MRVSADGGKAVPATVLDASRREISHRWPCFLPDGRHYLFTVRSREREVRGIYVGSLDSPEQTRLLSDLTNAAYAASTSGAGYVLFARGRSLLAQPFDSDRLRLAGEPVVVTDNVWNSTAWSFAAYSVSLDSVLVFDSSARGRDVEPTWFDRTGARRGTLGEFYSSQFSLSPNGTRVALDSLDPQTGTYRLWTVDLIRNLSARFRPASEDDEHSPVWSPDGARIAFASNNALFEQSAGGAGDKSLLLNFDGPLFGQDWSRDGRFLLYRRLDPKTKGDLWALPMGSDNVKKPFPIVQGESDENYAAFSPDGKWIAYDSDESGRREVYVQPFVKSLSPDKWQISKGGGLHPQWRGDGNELFYLSEDLAKMMAVTVRTKANFEAGVPQPLFTDRFRTGITPQFNVTPDGQRFLINVPMATEGSPPATVVLNWMAELKK